MTRWGDIKGLLKAATQRCFREYGSLDAVAVVLGCGKSQAHRFTQLDAPDVITADKIALIEAQTGVQPHITQALALINGHLLVPMPSFAGQGEMIGHLGALAREVGDVMSKCGQACSDGELTAEESRRLNLRTEVAEAMAVLGRMASCLETLETALEAAGEKSREASR